MTYQVSPEEFMNIGQSPSSGTGFDFSNIGQDTMGGDYLSPMLEPEAYAPGSFEPVSDFDQGYLPESAYSDPYVEEAPWWEQAANWAGNNAGTLAKIGLGGYGVYGDVRAGREKAELARDIANQTNAFNLANLDLERDKWQLSGGIDDMTRQALGMQMLVNRGRMTADQVNPWLNFAFTGRQGLMKDDPSMAAAFQTNPFSGAPMGGMVSQPTSANDFFMGLDPQQQTRGNQMAGFADGGAVAPRMGMRARLNQMRADRGIGVPKQVAPAMGQGVQGGGALGAFNSALGSAFNRAPSNMMGQFVPPPTKKPTMYAGGSRDFDEKGMTQVPPNPQWAFSQGMPAGAFGGALAGMGAMMQNQRKQPSMAMQTGGIQAPQQPPALANLIGNYTGSLQMAMGGYLHGGSSGQADDVNASLSPGEYVIDADTVAALGDGNNEAGAHELDRMRAAIRAHKRSAATDKIPPRSKGALSYLGRK